MSKGFISSYYCIPVMRCNPKSSIVMFWLFLLFQFSSILVTKLKKDHPYTGKDHMAKDDSVKSVREKNLGIMGDNIYTNYTSIYSEYNS